MPSSQPTRGDIRHGFVDEQGFVQTVLESLRTADVQQAHTEDRITFTGLTPWPGDLVCAEGHRAEGDGESGMEKRAAIFVGQVFFARRMGYLSICCRPGP